MSDLGRLGAEAGDGVSAGEAPGRPASRTPRKRSLATLACAVWPPTAKRPEDKPLQAGVWLTVITAVLGWVGSSLNTYQAENAKTSQVLRDTLSGLGRSVPAEVEKVQTSLAPQLDHIASGLDSLQASADETRGWVAGRLRCPACVCSGMPPVRVYNAPLLKDDRR